MPACFPFTRYTTETHRTFGGGIGNSHSSCRVTLMVHIQTADRERADVKASGKKSTNDDALEDIATAGRTQSYLRQIMNLASSLQS